VSREQARIRKRALRRLSLALALTASLAAPAAAAERGYSVTSFDRVRVEGPFLVTVTTGRAVSARATGDAAALDRVQLRVEGRTLLVRAVSSWSGFADGRNGPVRLALTTPALATAILLGSGTLDVDRMTGLRVILTVEGSGRLSARAIDTDNASLAVAGAGAIEAAGRARVAAVVARGQGSLSAAGLTVSDLTVVSETASPVTITATRSARVTASGLGPVEVGGSAACEVRQTGAGPVRCGSK
jgi:hypothetical protein